MKMAQNRELAYFIENEDFDAQIEGFGKYEGQVVQIVFRFSQKIDKLSNVLVNLLLERGVGRKRNREVLNDGRFNFFGVGFAKDEQFVYSTVLLAEKFVCLRDCVV